MRYVNLLLVVFTILCVDFGPLKLRMSFCSLEIGRNIVTTSLFSSFYFFEPMWMCNIIKSVKHYLSDFKPKIWTFSACVVIVCYLNFNVLEDRRNCFAQTVLFEMIS